jgi:uncharacterized protein (TIGR03084 family)
VADAAAYADLLTDLGAEHRELDLVVASLTDSEWARPTPAEGWTIRDQVSHLNFFDEQAIEAITDPEGFPALVEAFLTGGPGAEERSLAAGRDGTSEYLLTRWRQGRAALLRALRGLDPSARLPWYGPPMGAVSFATARLMETWAHGQDVVDTLGIARAPTSRLRHIAHLGVATMGHSFRTRGRDVPSEPVRVELAGPSGEMWTWGPEGAADAVRGPVLDFCLVVTQRRHPADTSLEFVGPVARAWMDIAQAFAGPAGSGREAAQFPR